MSLKSNPTCRISQSRDETQIYHGEFGNQGIVLKSTVEDAAIKRQNSNLPWKMRQSRDKTLIYRGGFGEQDIKF